MPFTPEKDELLKSTGDGSQLEVVIAETKIEPFFTPMSKKSGLPELPFTQISDHYGVSTVIRYS